MRDDDATQARQARDSGGAPLSEGVARDLSELARELEAETTTDAVMHRVVAAAVREIDGASGAAVKYGVLSALSFQLFVESHSMGALDVYADRPGAFDAEAENTGLLLACHAAIALAGGRKVDNLHLALQSRDTIGQAKGILMERYKIDAVQAFDLLIAASQATHRRLNSIAEQL